MEWVYHAALKAWRGMRENMIQPGEHVAIFGMTGSGKSTLTRKISSLFSRQIIFDRLGEWDGELVARDFVSFKQLYRSHYESPAFIIVYRPRAGMGGEELAQETDSILALVYQVESLQRQGLALIFEEVWLYAPLHAIPPWFQETMLTGRHARVSVIGNSQRPAHVSKTLVSQARHVFVGQFYEARDRKYFEESFGKIPELDNPPEKFHFYWFRTGEKAVYITTE